MSANDINKRPRILMLSRDPKIFESGSEARGRMLEYARNFDELHIIIFSKDLSKVIARSAATKQSYNNLFLYPARSLFDMYRIGKNLKCDFITAQDPFETGLIGYFLKKKLNLPLELQIHTDFLSPWFWRESLKNKIRVLLAKLLLPRAEKIRVVSERIKNSLSSLRWRVGARGGLIEVRPVAIDLEKIKNAPIKTDLHKKYPGKFIILMASRLTREKNIGLSLEVLREVLNSKLHTLNPLLLIVGDGPELKNLKFKIGNLKLENNVILEPYTEDLFSYYKTADLFFLTSNYEGYGRTVIEAQAAGCPVLMTDVGAAIGEIVPVGDKNALIAKLTEIIGKKS